MKVSATRVTVTALHFMVYDIWPFPPYLQKRLFRALHRSSCSRVTNLRYHLCLVGQCDLEAFFERTATPKYMMDLIDDLVAIGAFNRKEGTALQDAVLLGVKADGQWLSLKDYEERKVAHG